MLKSSGYIAFFGGARRDRTADPLHAMQVLSQLSYSPGSIEGAFYEKLIKIVKLNFLIDDDED